ncbi:DUF2125 domain-containing protein [Chthonobacter rhizosphaerae]|uniref:DUF2125 domain-containing protein n=1 Tax=Chthonobacter rhizosphaerae TaxID=2735553 RepID=UPI0015EFD379|nr:DUF2125 domain-containing protein [Chthonobacter rhizosphaerae]
MRRNVVSLLLLVALVVAGWTYAWTKVRDQVVAGLDRSIADLAADGVTVTCPERAVGGWPFRISVDCADPSVRLPDGSIIRAERLEANGAVVDPDLTVVRIAAPVTLTAPDGSHVDATFAEMRASVRMAEGRLGRVSVEARDLAVNGTVLERTIGRLTARHGEAHLSPQANAPESLEFAVVLTAANLTAGAADLLPAEADAGASMVVRQAGLIDGSPESFRAWTAAGGEIGITQIALDVGETRLEASGTARADDGGSLAGNLDVVGTGLAWLTRQVSAGKPLAAQLGALGTAFMIFGKPVEGAEGARRISVEMRDGAVTANGFALGSAPRLF